MSVPPLDEVCSSSAILNSKFLIRTLEFVYYQHDLYIFLQFLCHSVQVIVHFDKVFSVTWKRCQHSCHLRTKFEWKAFCSSRLLCKVNGSKKEICRFVSHKKIAKCIPKLILLIRFQVVVNDILPLPLWRTYIYIYIYIYTHTHTLRHFKGKWHESVSKSRDLRALCFSYLFI